MLQLDNLLASAFTRKYSCAHYLWNGTLETFVVFWGTVLRQLCSNTYPSIMKLWAYNYNANIPYYYALNVSSRPINYLHVAKFIQFYLLVVSCQILPTPAPPNLPGIRAGQIVMETGFIQLCPTLVLRWFTKSNNRPKNHQSNRLTTHPINWSTVQASTVCKLWSC